MKIFLLFFILVISVTAFCQDKYKKGYIVKNNGDTTTGSIREETEEHLSAMIDFKNQEGINKKLSIDDIKGFGLDKNHFRLVTYVDPLDSFKRKTHFAKLLLETSYQVFSFYRKDDLYFVVVSSDTSYLLYDDIRTAMGEITENGNFRNQLSFISHDCPTVQSSAEKILFAEQGLISFFRSLEKCRGNLQHAVIYYSKPRSEMNAYLVAGALAIKNETEIAAQALLQFHIPSLNKKTSLSTGLAYLKNSETETTTYSFGEIKKKQTTEIFELPLFIRYDMILEKRIQPYAYGGPGVLLKKEKDITTKTEFSTTTQTGFSEKSSFGPTFIFAAGIDIRVTKAFYIDLNWRYDLGVHLPVVGVACKIK